MFTDLQLTFAVPRICYGDETMSRVASRSYASVGTVRRRRSSGYRARQFGRRGLPGERPAAQPGHRHSGQNRNRTKTATTTFSNVRVGRYTVTAERPASPRPSPGHHRQRQRAPARRPDCRWARSPRRSRSRRPPRRSRPIPVEHGQLINTKGDRRAAAQRPQLLRPRAAHHRRRKSPSPSPDHAARGRVQRQRHAQHVQQLPAGRRGQQRLRHQQPGLLRTRWRSLRPTPSPSSK